MTSFGSQNGFGEKRKKAMEVVQCCCITQCCRRQKLWLAPWPSFVGLDILPVLLTWLALQKPRSKTTKENRRSSLQLWALYFCFVGELQRKIGLKVLEMRGNAVVGYLQCFDLEGESGLVVRAIGTACTLDKLSNTSAFLPACNSPSKEMKE